MSKKLYEESNISAIATAIRAKNGLQTTYKTSQMADAINSIETGGITPTGTKSITQNGTHDVTRYATADVNVPTTGITPTGTKNITANGTYDVTSFASALVDVASSGWGDLSLKTGTFINSTPQSVLATGLTIDIGLTSKAKALIMWLDKEDFATECSANNRFRVIAFFQFDASSFPPVKGAGNNTLADYTDCEYVCFAATNVIANTADTTGYSVSSSGTIVSYNPSVWSCNSDGTVTIGRSVYGTQYLPAGTFHYIAITEG